MREAAISSDLKSASTFGSGRVAGPFSGTNALGDTLVISRMSNTGILAVPAVPKPSTLAVMLGLLPVTMVRRRHTCACPTLLNAIALEVNRINPQVQISLHPLVG